MCIIQKKVKNKLAEVVRFIGVIGFICVALCPVMVFAQAVNMQQSAHWKDQAGITSLETGKPRCSTSTERVKIPYNNCHGIAACKAANTSAYVDHATVTLQCADGTCYTWRLVDRRTVGTNVYEVWRDDAGLTWSARIRNNSTTTFNWCHASGANNKPGHNYASNDPNDYCDGGYQNQTNPISLCKAGDGTTSGGFDTPSYTDNSKGGLGGWYLPTVEDYINARQHGIVQVLGDWSGYEWTSTVNASNTPYAWVFDISGGGAFSSNSDRSSSNGVRCVTAAVP
jgi:hypothetical protein